MRTTYIAQVVAAVSLLWLSASAFVLPTIQVAWLREQFIKPAVGIAKLGAPLQDLKASAANINFHFDSGSQSIPDDFWERAAALGYRVTAYAQEFLDTRAAESGVADAAPRFKDAVSAIVSTAGEIKADMLANTMQLHAESMDVSEAIGEALARVLAELQEAFPAPGEAPGHDMRQARVTDALQRARGAVLSVLVERGVQEHVAQGYMDKIIPHIEFLVVMTGDLAEQHPALLEALLFSVAIALIPEWWLLSRLLGMFGFGPYGPVKGTFAAWAQRFFFGAAVPEGSWFALLQQAAMRPVSWWWKWVFSGIAGAIGWAVGGCYGSR